VCGESKRVFVCVFAGNAAKSKQIEIGKQKKNGKTARPIFTHRAK